MNSKHTKYSIDEIDDAGSKLISLDKYSETQQTRIFEIVNTYRANHVHLLQPISKVLRKYASEVDSKALVPYRIKRLDSIKKKLEIRKGKFTLSEMQDIGGCRAIVNSISSVEQIVRLCKKEMLGHSFLYEDNYISNPNRKSGYRSHHLIFTVDSNSPNFKEFKGMRTEIQIRTQLQHAWATSVETIDALNDISLKIGRGPQGWRKFFKLMSAVFAIKENTSPIYGIKPNFEELQKQIKKYCSRYETESYLEKIRMTFNRSQKDAPIPYYWLIIFDAKRLTTWTISYSKEDEKKAFKKYEELERDNKSNQPIVLVSGESIGELIKSYPNYYMEIQPFQNELIDITGWEPLQDHISITQL